MLVVHSHPVAPERAERDRVMISRSVLEICTRMRRAGQARCDREKRLIMSINPRSLQSALWTAFIVLFILNLLDIASTIYGLKTIPFVYETNTIFAPLLHSVSGAGPAAAVFMKLIILVIPFMAVHYPVGKNRYELVLRVVKLGILLGIESIIPLYALIVAKNLWIICVFLS
jgi:hypothetical protein